MKKVLLIISLFLICGCYNSTPTKEVEKYFTDYQINPEKYISNIDYLLDFSDFSNEQREEFKKIIKNNYQNLEYNIKDEIVNANKATVITEINVYDYSRILNEALEYKNTYIDEFNDENGYNESKYIDYKIMKLKEAKEKVKYTLDINLTKIDGKWYIDDLSREYLEKINGIYNY